jgi:hypothetical protein
VGVNVIRYTVSLSLRILFCKMKQSHSLILAALIVVVFYS